MASPRFSVLDLAPVREGGSVAETCRNTLDLAKHAETWGFTRFWLAEHHNMPGIASAATSVLIGHVAAGTSTIRVGSGGVMLPNHSALVIAEQFGTLECLFPGRIDLGVGRAPGSDGLAARALGYKTVEEDFPRQVQELLTYLAPARPGQRLMWWDRFHVPNTTSGDFLCSPTDIGKDQGLARPPKFGSTSKVRVEARCRNQPQRANRGPRHG